MEQYYGNKVMAIIFDTKQTYLAILTREANLKISKCSNFVVVLNIQGLYKKLRQFISQTIEQQL